MTVRERALITGLSVALIVLTGALIGPSFVPASEVAAPSVAPAQAYVEGVLGHATNASPFGARSAADRDLVALLFRGLVRLGPGDSIVGDLAERWDVDDKGSTWTFHLRPDMRWQDGEPITAEDVVFTIGALSDPDYTGPGAESWREVTATAIDGLTVSLTLATPLGGFLQAATQPIAPAHLLSFVPSAQLAADPFGRQPVGSGSFKLVTLDGSRAVLDAWSPAELGSPPPIPGESVAATDSLGTPGPSEPPAEPAPYLAGIEFDFFDTVDDLKAAWQRGSIDGASGLQPTDARALAASGGARLVRYPGSSLTAVVLNLRTGKSPFGADVNVRKALFESIDRDALVSGVLAGLAVRADNLIPPSSPLFDEASSKQVPFDVEAAKKGLTDAGWTLSADGAWVAKGATEPVTFDLLSPEEAANPVAYAIADNIAKQWRAVGLKVTHVAQAAAQPLAERLRSGDYVAAVLPLAVGLDPDLYPILASSQTRSGGSNVSGIQDPDLDKLLSAARAPGTDEVRKAAYAALQAKIAETFDILPIAFRDDYVVLKNRVQGPAPRSVGTSGDRFWDVLTWRLADGL